MKLVLYIFFLLFSGLFGINDDKDKKYTYYDGPYITVKEDSTHILWIDYGDLKDTSLYNGSAKIFNETNLPKVDLTDLDFEEDPVLEFNNVPKFLALSDIHGQDDLFRELLRAHQVIDEENKWIYGDGHLVIVGDIFDRGPKVMESLWFLFFLEKEAKAAGGKVHVLLGNHELMVMHGDLGYLNKKYRYTMGISRTPYANFFSNETVLGKWLRSKKICVKINDMAFVHAGFSKNVIEKEKSLKVINQLFKSEIYDNPRIPWDTTNFISDLFFDNGPLWYRGYANPGGFDIDQANFLLEALNVKSIVVGHTSMPRLIPIHNDKIILIDSSIKFGKSGEVLIYEQDSLYRGLLSGEKTILDDDDELNTARSPFQYVYDANGGLDYAIEVDTDLDSLFVDYRDNEKYLEAKMVSLHSGEYNRTWDIRIRTRGKTRKTLCEIPPLKLDFSKTTLEYLGFRTNDKLNLALPCDKTADFQEKLYREHLVYKLYQVLDPYSLRTKLVRVTLLDKGKETYELDGIFIEDEKEFVQRKKIRLLDKGIIKVESLERSSYLKMVFFQYLILNTDWDVDQRHNLEMIGIPGEVEPRAVPFDFDFAGIVDQEYAKPHEDLPINFVREPYFRGKKVSKKEVSRMRDFYNSKKEELIEVVNDADYISEESREVFLARIERFYKTLNFDKGWKQNFMFSYKQLEFVN